MKVAKFPLNKKGRDFVVGDIHGAYTKLITALDSVNFNTKTDRLFSVGDLVDRGTENEEVIALLDSKYFHAIRGNHDDFAIQYHRLGNMDDDLYSRNGGNWFMELHYERKEKVVQAIEKLPLAMEIKTVNGSVGVIHADVPYGDWKLFQKRLPIDEECRNMAMWSRERFISEDTTLVKGIDHVIVGHNCHLEPIVLGNVYHIDTGGWLPDRYNGKFTLLEISKAGIFDL